MRLKQLRTQQIIVNQRAARDDKQEMMQLLMNIRADMSAAKAMSSSPISIPSSSAGASSAPTPSTRSQVETDEELARRLQEEVGILCDIALEGRECILLLLQDCCKLSFVNLIFLVCFVWFVCLFLIFVLYWMQENERLRSEETKAAAHSHTSTDEYLARRLYEQVTLLRRVSICTMRLLNHDRRNKRQSGSRRKRRRRKRRSNNQDCCRVSLVEARRKRYNFFTAVPIFVSWFNCSDLSLQAPAQSSQQQQPQQQPQQQQQMVASTQPQPVYYATSSSPQVNKLSCGVSVSLILLAVLLSAF